MGKLQWVDLIIIAIIGFSALTGLFRGFIKELIALGVWVIGIWVAYKYSASLDPWLQKYIQDKSARTLISFIVILLGVLIAGGLINAILGLIFRGSGLGAVDKILGACFGFARGVFILSLIISVLGMTSLPFQQYVQNSRLYPQLIPVVNWISGYLPHLINQVKTAQNSFHIIDISPDS